jgi:predicted dehydrogenase
VTPLRVGVIGASLERSWAAEAHLPALAALNDFSVSAVCTTRRESAEAAARHVGARHALTDPESLVALDDVDVVAVCVKVPTHVEIVGMALAAHKHIYCEWPLAPTADEAATLERRARLEGVRAIVGLQARAAPALMRARELLVEGYAGRLLSAVVTGTTKVGGAIVPRALAFAAEAAAGVNVLTVPAAHALDALLFCTGPPRALDARLAVQTRRATVEETGESLAVTAPDQVQLMLELDDGAAATVHVQGGAPRARFRMEFFGTEGRLELAADAHLQRAELRLRGARGDAALQPLPVADDLPPGVVLPAGPPANVGRMYLRLASAIRGAHELEPGFDEGVKLHCLLEAAVMASARPRHPLELLW